jgi:hypothetical protein
MHLQNYELSTRSLFLGAAITMAAAVGVHAADLAYPPQYGAVAPPAVVPPQVIVPAPAVVPQYNGAPVVPRVVGPSYGVPPPAAGVPIAPRRPCAPAWRCGPCGGQAGCTPYPERYPAPYESLGPQVYPGRQTQPAAEPYSGEYAPPPPRVYSGPIGPYPADRGPYRP